MGKRGFRPSPCNHCRVDLASYLFRATHNLLRHIQPQVGTEAFTSPTWLAEPRIFERSGAMIILVPVRIDIEQVVSGANAKFIQATKTNSQQQKASLRRDSPVYFDLAHVIIPLPRCLLAFARALAEEALRLRTPPPPPLSLGSGPQLAPIWRQRCGILHTVGVKFRFYPLCVGSNCSKFHGEPKHAKPKIFSRPMTSI